MISPYLPPSCRFTPTCSEYTRQAIERYGVLKGITMGLKRLSRCHPASSGGFHPVSIKKPGAFFGKSRSSCFVLSPIDVNFICIDLFYAPPLPPPSQASATQGKSSTSPVQGRSSAGSTIAPDLIQFQECRFLFRKCLLCPLPLGQWKQTNIQRPLPTKAR